MPSKKTVPGIVAMKANGEKIVCATGYDVYFASLLDEVGVDVLLVGDSLGNTILGYDSTVFVDLEDMVRHTKAVRNGVQNALLLSDLPFGSYGGSVEQALVSASRLIKAGAEAVKLEGCYEEEIRALVKAGIPVAGHLGLTPQSVNVFGGHKVQGRDDDAAQKLLEDALRIQEAGAFAIVLELIPAELSKKISEALTIPTIGIGAGPDCDGEVQVLHDLLGFSRKTYKHAKRYVDGNSMLYGALSNYVREVRTGQFPTKENSF